MNFSSNIMLELDNCTLLSNQTATYQLPGLVAVLGDLIGLVTIISIFFDVLVIVTFAKKPSLITPYSVQFLNLVIIQLCTMLYDGPLNVICMIDSKLFFQPVFCAVYKFGAWTFPSLAFLQQMAIAIDRWTALFLPVWRRGKSVKYGVQVTLGLVLYYFALYLPLFVVDTLTGVPSCTRCDYHHVWQNYQVFVRVATFYFPAVFVYLSFPLLVFILRKRQHVAVEEVVPVRLGSNRVHHQNLQQPKKNSVILDGQRNLDKDGNSRTSTRVSYVKDGSDDPVPSGRPKSNSKQVSFSPEKAQQKKRKLNLSMWSMLAETIFTMPLMVTYTMIQYAPNAHDYPYLNDVNVISILLMAVDIFVNPIMYWTFFLQLRVETLRLLRALLGFSLLKRQ